MVWLLLKTVNEDITGIFDFFVYKCEAIKFIDHATGSVSFQQKGNWEKMG